MDKLGPIAVLVPLVCLFWVPHCIRITHHIWNWTVGSTTAKMWNILVLWCLPILASYYFGKKFNIRVFSKSGASGVKGSGISDGGSSGDGCGDGGC